MVTTWRSRSLSTTSPNACLAVVAYHIRPSGDASVGMPQLFYDGVERIFDPVCQHLAVYTRNRMLVIALQKDGAATGALPKDDGVDMSRRFVSHH